MMLYLSIDLGQRRTGLAVGDDATGVVTPLEVIETEDRGELLAALAEAIEQHEPDAFVVGLPLNMDGTEGPAAEAARQFGGELERLYGRPVHLQDERLTSFAADQAMARSGRTHKQKRRVRDALAAAAILRDFLGL